MIIQKMRNVGIGTEKISIYLIQNYKFKFLLKEFL